MLPVLQTPFVLLIYRLLLVYLVIVKFRDLLYGSVVWDFTLVLKMFFLGGIPEISPSHQHRHRADPLRGKPSIWARTHRRFVLSLLPFRRDVSRSSSLLKPPPLVWWSHFFPIPSSSFVSPLFFSHPTPNHHFGSRRLQGKSSHFHCRIFSTWVWIFLPNWEVVIFLLLWKGSYGCVKQFHSSQSQSVLLNFSDWNPLAFASQTRGKRIVFTKRNHTPRHFSIVHSVLYVISIPNLYLFLPFHWIPGSP